MKTNSIEVAIILVHSNYLGFLIMVISFKFLSSSSVMEYRASMQMSGFWAWGLIELDFERRCCGSGCLVEGSRFQKFGVGPQVFPFPVLLGFLRIASAP